MPVCTTRLLPLQHAMHLIFACIYVHACSVKYTSEHACIEPHAECIQCIYAFASSMWLNACMFTRVLYTACMHMLII